MAESARDPFTVLGLRADDDLTDDDVRIAWRRIASATHPDRADGGDPGRFALAAAAYTDLRTEFGRNEARAELTGGPPGWPPIAAPMGRARLVRLLLRLAVAAAAALLGGTAAGWNTPGAPALVVGALTWFLVTGLTGVGAGGNRPGRAERPLRARADAQGGQATPIG